MSTSENGCINNLSTLPPFIYWHVCLYTALLQTPTTSDVVLVLDSVQLLQTESWPEIATHMGFSADYIESVYYKWRDAAPGIKEDSFHSHCLYQVSGDWAAKKEGTDSRPRNWKTLLEVFKRCCRHSKEDLSRLSGFEKKLIHGVDLNTAL